MGMRSIRLSFLATVVLLPPLARAMTIRYAVVVGNNRGVDTDGTEPFPKLKHAETEAGELRDRLVTLSNFDPSPRRTKLLVGATRAQVIDALVGLRAQKESDLRTLGKADTLLAFFYTGHGLAGRLLLDDGPLSGKELGELFRSVEADFTVGVFDACYSGSLDPALLASKGIQPTPGLNLFRELPEEVLTTEGSVWFVSSGPDQASYEDQRLGGVFTHFFIQALERADRDGPGITLDRIWHYARENTVEYTTKRNRRQVPQQFVAKLKATGPLYFSFPLERSASLVLAEGVEGQFVLSYAGGQLTEMIQKEPGVRRELAVYPGRGRLMLIRDGKVHAQEELELEAGAKLVLRTNPDPAPDEPLGRRRKDLWEKGFGSQTLTATAVRPGSSLLVGLGYELGTVPAGVVQPRHAFVLSLRLDRSEFSAGARVGYGTDSQDFSAWSYRAHACYGALWAGYGFDLGPTRLGVGGELGLARLWQEFKDGQEQAGWLLRPAATLGLMLFTRARTPLEVSLRAGAAYAPGAGAGAPNLWRGFVAGGLTVYFRAL